MRIYTNLFFGGPESTIEIVYSDGQWQCWHEYKKGKRTEILYDSERQTTEETLKYLKKCKEKIEMDKNRLDRIHKKLVDIIEKIEKS